MSGTLTELRQKVQARRDLPRPAECRRIRQLAGVSANDLAEAIGVSDAAVRHWERGIREPRGANLTAYLQALDVLREASSSP